ncbi:MAG: hypothetical protein DRO76_03010 [Candidatus Altiarchaeales archaeon]|nr:MAG: hypothetical protein DRO76_03010 [Candidatus Altiarchaeales archaeon]
MKFNRSKWVVLGILMLVLVSSSTLTSAQDCKDVGLLGTSYSHIDCEAILDQQVGLTKKIWVSSITYKGVGYVGDVLDVGESKVYDINGGRCKVTNNGNWNACLEDVTAAPPSTTTTITISTTLPPGPTTSTTLPPGPTPPGPPTALEEIKSKIAMAACYILSILITLVAAVAALFIVLSGIKYIGSGEDPSGRQEAKSRLVWALIGLIIALMACPLVEILKIPPLEGGCYDCAKYGIVITTPSGMVQAGDPDGPKVIIYVEPQKAKPNEDVKIICIANDPDGLDIGVIEIYDPMGSRTDRNPLRCPGHPTSFNNRENPVVKSFSSAGQYKVTCRFRDTTGKIGSAIIYFTVSDSTYPAAVIDSIGGKSFAELMKNKEVERDLRKRIYVKGHAEGGSGNFLYGWKVDGDLKHGPGTVTEGWMKDMDLGIHTIEFTVADLDTGQDSTISIEINVVKYTGGLECSTKEDCKAKDTDGGNNPEKKGTCSKMRCHPRGYCEEEAPHEDRCQNSIILIEQYPDEKYKYMCKEDPINCYDYCGGRGGKCLQHGPDEDTCKCLEKNCMMRPSSTTITDLHLNDGNCYLVVDEMGVGAKAYVKIKIKELYYKTEGTSCCEPPWATGCDAKGKVIQADLGGDRTSKEFECKDGWEGKCKVTIETYRADHNEYYSVCVEDVT